MMNKDIKQKDQRGNGDPDLVDDSGSGNELLMAIIKQRAMQGSQKADLDNIAAGANRATGEGDTSTKTLEEDGKAKRDYAPSAGLQTMMPAVGVVALDDGDKLAISEGTPQMSAWLTARAQTDCLQYESPTTDLSTSKMDEVDQNETAPGAYAQTAGRRERRRPSFFEETTEDLDLSEANVDLEDPGSRRYAPSMATHQEMPPAVESEDNGNSGLVTAFPVHEDGITTAEAVDDIQPSTKQRSFWVIAASVAALLFLVAIIVPTTIVVVMSSTNNDQSGKVTSNPKHPEASLALSLPDFTTTAILEDPVSPQAKAYSWLLEDPFFDEFTEARKLQRFVLATLYHATNGDGWSIQKDWLSYEAHECQDWYSQVSNIPGEFQVCNGEDEYTSLVLTSNTLIGSIPPELGLLSSLQLLLLGNNYLAGSIPQSVWDIPALGMLALNGNQLTGSLLPEHLKAIQHGMVWLDLHDNNLQGTLATELGLLTACTHLGLNDNRFTGTVSPELGQMTNMERIALSATKISGSIPPELFTHWGKLAHLELRENELSSSIPTEIGFLTALKEFYLYDCSLTGTIPSEIALLSNMTNFVASSNELSASIPEELWGLTHLNDFFLYGNLLSGSLATEVGLLTDLVRLDVGVNSMVGTIPSTLGLLTKLTHLRLSDNAFEGSLPSSVWNFASLEFLWVNGNVSGSIPGSVGASLREVNLTGSTFISGTIPTNFCSIQQLDFDCSDILCGCECSCDMGKQP